jgi:signal transduction histidine kinase
VLETHQPFVLQRPTLETIESFAQSEEHRRALVAADIRSLVAVPLLVHERLLGAIAFVSSTDGRLYGPAEVRLAEELATRAALSIDNARLYQAARRATTARDEVLGIVAHDLRNPLNGILMATRLQGRGRGEAERRSRRPGEIIERSALRMKRLIEDLLDVTRLEAGRLSVDAAGVDAEPILSDSVHAQEGIAAAASLELRRDVSGQLPVVRADSDRLLQVFENLIGNAIKFTAPGGRVTVGASPRNGEVLFWVSDTGRGIAPEELPHLFDRFWQGRIARGQGAGLGLPIVKGIVEAHGGRIWVETSPGLGTTFRFTIPTARRPEESRPAAAAHPR